MTLLRCSSKFAKLYTLSLCNWRASEASETLLVVVQWKTRYVYTYILILVMCSVSTNGERAGLANLKLTIDSLLEYS